MVEGLDTINSSFQPALTSMVSVIVNTISGKQHSQSCTALRVSSGTVFTKRTISWYFVKNTSPEYR